MAIASDRKNRTISIRMPESDHVMIRCAAFLQGRSRAEFIRKTAVTAAIDTLLEHRPVRMSHDGFADFLGLLARTPKAVPQLADVLSRPAPWETDKDKQP